MDVDESDATDEALRSVEPPRGVVVVAWLAAAWCVGFALTNVLLATTGRLATGRYADYAGGLSVMNWVAFALKLLGAAVALLSVAVPSRRVRPERVAVLVWGAAGLLGLYSLGSLVEAVGMLTGVLGTVDGITPASVGYLLFFLLGAACFGVLARSHSRRHAVQGRYAVIGVAGAPAVLALLLLGIPLLLSSLGLMPA